MRVTPSALFLAQWMLQRSKYVEGALPLLRTGFSSDGTQPSTPCRVGASLLELGCGLALNGLAAAAMGAARAVRAYLRILLLPTRHTMLQQDAAHRNTAQHAGHVATQCASRSQAAVDTTSGCCNRQVLTDYSPRLLRNLDVAIATNVDRKTALRRERVAVAYGVAAGCNRHCCSWLCVVTLLAHHVAPWCDTLHRAA
jgi:hypothetical protein